MGKASSHAMKFQYGPNIHALPMCNSGGDFEANSDRSSVVRNKSA